MLDKNEILKKLKNDFPYLKSEFAVKRIGLFGSFATNTSTMSSDIDLLVEFDRPLGFKFFDLVEYLENCFGKKIDLLTQEGLQNIRQKEISSSIERNIIYVEAA